MADFFPSWSHTTPPRYLRLYNGAARKLRAAMQGPFPRSPRVGGALQALSAATGGLRNVPPQVSAYGELAPYPFSEDPLSRMERNGVMRELGDPELILVDWDTNIYAQVGQNTHASAKIVQHAIHLTPGLRNVVLLAQLVDLLRSHQHELSVLDAVTHLLRWLRQ